MEAQAFADTPRGQLAEIVGEKWVEPPVPFDLTERYKLQQANAVEVEPVEFFTEGGASFVSTDPGEINRLKLSRSHFLTPEAAADPAAEDDHRFHPGEAGVTVEDVLAYLTEHPEDTERVLEEERAGKNRSTLLEQFED